MAYEKGISVIIPIYNVEKFFPVCIDSVINQTFKELEIICVIDKNSSDNSEQIARNFAKKDSRIKIITPKDGNGPGYNRNVGLQHVAREYISFIDSDDYIDNDFYERLYDSAKLFDSDVVMGEILLYRNELGCMEGYRHYPFCIVSGLDDIFNVVTEGVCWDKIYRSEFILSNNFGFPTGILHEDNLFLLEVAHKCNHFVVMPGSYYFWIRNENSICFNPDYENKRAYDGQAVLKMLIEYMEKNQISDTLIRKIIKFMLDKFGSYVLKSDTYDTELENLITKYFSTEDAKQEVKAEKSVDIHDWTEYTKDFYTDKFDGVSVVVSIDDTCQNVQRCLDSLISQSLQKLEILCVMKNGLDSDIKKTVEDYAQKDNRIKIITCDDSCVLKNKGIDNAVKSYIGFVDGNDYVDKDFYENLYRAVNIFESDTAQGEFCIEAKNEDYQNQFSVEYTLKKIHEKLKIPYMNNKIYKTGLIKDNNIRVDDNKIFGYNIFNFEILLRTNKFVTVPNVKYHSGSKPIEETDERFETEVEDAYKTLVEMCKLLKTTNISLEDKSVVLENHIQNYGIKALGYPKYSKILSEMIEEVIVEQ